MLTEIEDKLQLFDTITLAEMEKVKLMNRVDPTGISCSSTKDAGLPTTTRSTTTLPT